MKPLLLVLFRQVAFTEAFPIVVAERSTGDKAITTLVLPYLALDGALAVHLRNKSSFALTRPPDGYSTRPKVRSRPHGLLKPPEPGA